MSHSTDATHETPTGGVQEDQVDIRAVFGFGLGLAVVTAIAHILMLWMFSAEVAGVDAANPARVFPLAAGSQEERRPPEPRLQGGVRTDTSGRQLPGGAVSDQNLGVRDALKSLREEEDRLLTGYGWVDRNGQIVRIPVADAMKLTLQRGLPSRQQAAGEAPAATASAIQEKK